MWQAMNYYTGTGVLATAYLHYKPDVSRKFNIICGEALNRGFFRMERYHSSILKKVKGMLPRRESERRIHPLARHCDILSAIETRINMLDMTFLKYIDSGACCFIPGKVIDEILLILRVVGHTNAPPRANEVLQELRDISSMAMEYFDEKIAPNLKIIRQVPSILEPSASSNFNPTIPVVSVRETWREFSMLKNNAGRNRIAIKIMKSLITRLTNKVRKQNKKIYGQERKLREQTATIREQNASIAELKRHVDEWDLKFAELSTKINRSREETSQNTIATTSSQTSSQLPMKNRSYSPPRYSVKPNIKPRIAQIAPKSIIVNNLIENERKRKCDNLLRNPASQIPAKISKIQKPEDNLSLSIQNLNYFNAIPQFQSSSLETLLKNPITSLKSRKRKIQ